MIERGKEDEQDSEHNQGADQSLTKKSGCSCKLTKTEETQQTDCTHRPCWTEQHRDDHYRRQNQPRLIPSEEFLLLHIPDLAECRKSQNDQRCGDQNDHHAQSNADGYGMLKGGTEAEYFIPKNTTHAENCLRLAAVRRNRRQAVSRPPAMMRASTSAAMPRWPCELFQTGCQLVGVRPL